jgi:hypothetical protein
MSDMMLKTPTAMDAEMGSPKREPKSGDSGCLAQEIMGGYTVILPTPNAVEAEKYTKTYNKDSQMGRSLTAMAVNGLLPTPLASDGMNCGVRTIKGARKERPGLLNISDMASLNLLPTPLAVSVRHPGRVSELRMAGDVTFCSRAVGETRPNGLEDWLEFHGLMPSPVAQDYRRRGSNSRQQGLPEVCHRLLHTPIADGLKKRTVKGQKRMSAEDFEAMFPENGGSPASKDGRASQLNPLFVGEMMGYPLEWLTSPFRSGDGEGRP